MKTNKRAIVSAVIVLIVAILLIFWYKSADNYCQQEDVREASSEIYDVLVVLQTQISALTEYNPDYTVIANELIEQKNKLINISVPECMDGAKTYIFSAIVDTISAVQYASMGQYQDATRCIGSAMDSIYLAADEFEYIAACQPDCKRP